VIILSEENKHEVNEEHKHEVKEEHKHAHNEEHKHMEHKEHIEHKPFHKEHKPEAESKKFQMKKADMWKILGLVLGVLFIISLFTHGFSGKGAEVKAGDKQVVADDTIKYINQYLLGGQGSATLKEVTEDGGLYAIKMSINNRDYTSYVSKDGKYLFPQGIDITQTPETAATPAQTPQEVKKSDKPKVEAFVMSHCPYGTQIEKGLIPVIETLGSKADIEIKFVNYAMHGEKEVLEEWAQYCIQKEQNAKYITYLKCFLKEGKGEECLTTVGIDKAALETCKKAADTQFKITENLNDKTKWSGGSYPPFLIYDAENKQYGVSGSPTLVINGQQASSGRDSASLLKTICSAFNTPPAECDTQLSSASPSAGFGFETTDAATAASCG